MRHPLPRAVCALLVALVGAFISPRAAGAQESDGSDRTVSFGLEAGLGYAALGQENAFGFALGLPLVFGGAGAPVRIGVRPGFQYHIWDLEIGINVDAKDVYLLTDLLMEIPIGDGAVTPYFVVGGGWLEREFSANGVSFVDATASGAILHLALGTRFMVNDSVYLAPEFGLLRGYGDEVEGAVSSISIDFGLRI